MPKYKLFHPDTEILGQAILDFERIAGGETIARVLRNHRLTNLDPRQWYPGQVWIDALNDLAETGGMFDFVSLGIRQMDLIEWPPEFDEMGLYDILSRLEDVYHAYYRGTDTGNIACEEIGAQHLRMIICTFEPDDLWYGNLYQIARHFLPDGTPLTVYYDEDEPRREQGGEVTIIHIEWE